MERVSTIKNNRLIVNIKVLPGSSSAGLKGIVGSELVIRLNAAPEKGKANKELCALLSAYLGCARSAIAIVAGQKSRHKKISLSLDLTDRLQKLLNV